MTDFTFHGHDTAHDILEDVGHAYNPTCVLYLGACCGYEAGLIADKYPEAAVYAVEACKETYDRFLGNTRECAGPRVIAHNLAIGEFDGTATLNLDESNTKHSVLRQVDAGRTGETREVRMASLATYCKELAIAPDVLVIDLEGIAVRALRGLGEDLMAGVNCVIAETEPAGANVFEGGDTNEDFAWFMSSHAFRLEKLWLPGSPVRQLNSVWVRWGKRA